MELGAVGTEPESSGMNLGSLMGIDDEATMPVMSVEAENGWRMVENKRWRKKSQMCDYGRNRCTGACGGDCQTVGDIMNLQGEWERIDITVDSGAVDTVAPKEVARRFPLISTEASAAGLCYRAANNTRIPIHGKKEVKGVTEQGMDLTMDMRIAEVKKPLGSVRRFCEANNKVVFDEEGSYIENKRNGQRIPIKKENGVYYMTMWVAPEEGFKRQD